MTAATKREGQELSVAPLSEQTKTDFLRVIESVPVGMEVTVNTVRDLLDAAGIPERSRGGLFYAAQAAGLIKPVTVGGYPARVPSTGGSAHHATVRVYRRVNPEAVAA